MLEWLGLASPAYARGGLARGATDSLHESGDARPTLRVAPALRGLLGAACAAGPKPWRLPPDLSAPGSATRRLCPCPAPPGTRAPSELFVSHALGASVTLFYLGGGEELHPQPTKHPLSNKTVVTTFWAPLFGQHRSRDCGKAGGQDLI